MNLLWKKTYILSTAILRPHRHLYWNSIVYTIHDKNSDFLDDNGEGKNKFHKFIYLVNKLHGECSERENEFAPKMCISATMIIVVNFSDGLQTRKFSPPYFLVVATVLNGFCKFCFLLISKEKWYNNKTFRYRKVSVLTWYTYENNKYDRSEHVVFRVLIHS